MEKKPSGQFPLPRELNERLINVLVSVCNEMVESGEVPNYETAYARLMDGIFTEEQREAFGLNTLFTGGSPQLLRAIAMTKTREENP